MNCLGIIILGFVALAIPAALGTVFGGTGLLYILAVAIAVLVLAQKG